MLVAQVLVYLFGLSSIPVIIRSEYQVSFKTQTQKQWAYALTWFCTLSLQLAQLLLFPISPVVQLAASRSQQQPWPAPAAVVQAFLVGQLHPTQLEVSRAPRTPAYSRNNKYLMPCSTAAGELTGKNGLLTTLPNPHLPSRRMPGTKRLSAYNKP